MTNLKQPVWMVLFSLLLFATLTNTASAQEEDWPGTGILALRGEGNTAGQSLGNAVHLGTDIRMEIQGMTNRVQVHQRFSNTTTEWVEGVYTFPLPEDSAVNSVRLVLDERELVAVIQENAEARRQYDDARQAGKKAALTEQQRPNLFTQSVANIAPGETVDVYIQYLQPVRYEGGRFSIRYPMTVTPRYSPGAPLHTLDDYTNQPINNNLRGWALPTQRVPDADRISPHYLPQGENSLATLNLRLAAGMPVALAESTSHEISIKEETGDPYTLNIGFAAGSEAMNRDFEFVWQPGVKEAPLAASFTEVVRGDEAGNGGNTSYVQLMMVPPVQANTTTTAMARDLIIVLDTSGSMAGSSIQAAKLGVEKALDALGPDDYFNLIEFNTSHRALFSQAVPASDANITRARNFVRRLQADGGTNMAPALNEALQQSTSELAAGRTEEQSRVRQIVFITDGSVGNEREVFQLIHDKLGKSRLFTVGIGSAPNSYFMTRAAEQGRGSFMYIADINEVENSMGRLFTKLENPVITGLNVQWPAGVLVDQYPSVVPDLYAGEPVVVTAKVTGTLPANTVVTLTGQTGAIPWTRELSISGTSAKPENSVLTSGLAAAWGRLKIEDLMSSTLLGAQMQTVREKVIETSVEYQLLSQFTSFIAVEQAVSRPLELPLMGAHVPVDIPSGQLLATRLSGQGQGLKVVMPATATGLIGHLLTGLLALFGVVFIFWRSRHKEVLWGN